MGLREHVIRKLISTIPTFLVASVLIFSLMHLAPGDPVELMFRGSGRPKSPEIIDNVQKLYGLDKPLYVQYFMWLGKFVRGDLGFSYITDRNIIDEVRSRIWWTLELVGLAEIFALLLALLLGVVAATKKGSIIDNAVSSIAIFGYSMPTFWMGLIFILVFGVRFRWFPIFGGITAGEKITTSRVILSLEIQTLLKWMMIFGGALVLILLLVRIRSRRFRIIINPEIQKLLKRVMIFGGALVLIPVLIQLAVKIININLAGLIDHLRHLVMPLIVMSLSYTAYYFRLVRSSMLECLGQDYVTTARSKGLKERVVIYKHTVRNALIPVVTTFGTSIGFLLAGAVVIETVFAWPGLGKYIVSSALARDYPAIMGINMLIVLMVLFANLATDIANAIIDPRIRY